jgi:hypothetical protein
MKPSVLNVKKIGGIVLAAAAGLGLAGNKNGRAATFVEIWPNHSNYKGYGFGVSDSGRAVGYTYGANAPSYGAFMTEAQAGINESTTCIHHLLDGLISGGMHVSIAFDIYQAGSTSSQDPIRVVGDCAVPQGHWQAFFYHENQDTAPVTKNALLLSEPPNCGASSAQAVSASGSDSSLVVGYANSSNRVYAYSWWGYNTGSFSPTNIGALYFQTTSDSYALDTDGSRIVGYYIAGGSSQYGFVINGGSAHALSVSGATNPAALGINDNSLIVGYAVQSGNTKPVFWRYLGSANPTATVLTTSTYSHGAARGVNNNGVIVGSVWNTAYPTTGYDEVACHWNTNGTLTLLADIGASSTIRAYKVSSSSSKHIVGLANVGGYRNAFNFYGW